MNTRVAIVLCLFCGLLSCSSEKTTDATRVGGDVVLSISGLTATRDGRYVHIRCFAQIDNRSGSELIVKSNFFSAFDGLLALVKTPDGRTLGKTSFLMHQSPYSPEPRDFLLPLGKTSHTLSFMSDVVPPEEAEIAIEVMGDLPGSRYDRQLRSNSVTVKVTQEKT